MSTARSVRARTSDLLAKKRTRHEEADLRPGRGHGRGPVNRPRDRRAARAYITSVTPPNGTNPESLPVWLELVRNGASYTGYYSYDGQDWLTVGTATVAGQDATQGAGMFVTSHAAGAPGQAVFDGFSVAGAAATPPAATSYEAEAPAARPRSA
jgi:hypothetical protein